MDDLVVLLKVFPSTIKSSGCVNAKTPRNEYNELILFIILPTQNNSIWLFFRSLYTSKIFKKIQNKEIEIIENGEDSNSISIEYLLRK
jgi:hypothetical protein